MSKNFENGIITSSDIGSDDLNTDITTTGVVYWVDSVTGSDSNSGTNRNQPKATLASAYSSATANNGDMIILFSTHAETLTSSQTLSKAGVRIFGLGSGSAKPSFTLNGNVDMFDFTGVRQQIHNVRFPASTSANTARINVGAINLRVFNCDFTCGVNDLDTITIPAAGLDPEFNGCTFTVSADGPDRAISVESASALGIKIYECSFNGGSYDWDDAAIYSAVAHTEFEYRTVTLTNKASIIHTAAAKGQCIGPVMGDGSRIEV